MYEDENNLYHYSYRKGNEYDPNVPIDTKNYADEPSDQNRGSGKKKGTAKIVALALVCALVGGLVGAGASSAAAKVNHTSVQVSDREVAQVQTVKVDGKTQMTMPEVYASNVNSVVSINVSATTNYFGQTVQTAASGTGFFITEDGYILTNHHVISDASSVKVTLYNGETYDATVIGSDEDYDIAVINARGAGRFEQGRHRRIRRRCGQSPRRADVLDERGHRFLRQPRHQCGRHAVQHDPGRLLHQPRQLRRPALQ